MDDEYKNVIGVYYIAKDKIDMLRGFSMIIIILSHLTPDLSILLRIILPSGIAVFVFSTVYGLIIQYYKMGENYLNGFIMNKMVKKLIVPYLIVGILATIITNILDENRWEWRASIWINWYVIFSLVIYICYYIIFKYVRSKRKRIFAAVSSVLGYTAFCLLIGLSSTWYQAVTLVLVSLLFIKKSWVTEFIENHRITTLVVSFVLLHIANLMTMDIINFPLAGILGAEMVCVFTVVVMIIAIPMLNEVKYVSSYLKWIGRNSYLFYLLHTMLITICNKLELSKIISYFAIIISISLIICIKQVIMRSCMKYAS